MTYDNGNRLTTYETLLIPLDHLRRLKRSVRLYRTTLFLQIDTIRQTSVSANFAEPQCTHPSTSMRSLIYTVLIIAIADVCANAELNGAIDEQTNDALKMCKCACMIHEATAMVSSLQTYDNLNNGMGAEELYDTHCAGLVDVSKCFSNCNKGHKISQSMEKEDKALLAPSILPGVEIVKKNCFKIREIFSNREPVFDCAKKIYPFIAKSEENAKCRKMCCSEPNDKAGLYACSVREGYQQWVTTDYASSAEDMCQFACVIDQAAKHSYNLCSWDLTKMLVIAHQDVLKIYETMKKFT